MPVSELQKYRTSLNINNAIMHHRSRDGLFQEINKVLQPILKFDRISILVNLPEKENWDYFSPAIGPLIPGLTDNLKPPQKALIPIRAMTEKRTIVVNVKHEPLLPESKMLLKAGLNGFICIPLVIRDKVLGSIQLFYKNSFPFSDDQIPFFEDITQQIAIAVDNMLAHEELEEIKDGLAEETSYLQKEIAALSDMESFIFVCPVIQRLLDNVKNVASTDTTVLITGETGTGKDLLAHRIHNLSSRNKKLFIKVNCAALVPTLIESELFGHEKGAFTGAGARKIGRFEIADKGTIFLDEIGELPLNTQAKLLQVLQDGVFERVGGAQTIKTDVRIVAATNQNLQKMVRKKKFREDLFFRLNIFPVHITPLRERKEDIPVLGRHFVNKYSTKLNRRRPSLDNDVIAMLMDYLWPGNVRELQNVIERLIILKSGQTVTRDDLASVLSVTAESEEELMTLEAVEKKHLEKILGKTGGVISGPQGACRLLDLKRGTLLYRLKKLGVNPADFKNGAP